MSPTFDRIKIDRDGQVGTITIRAWWNEGTDIDDIVDPTRGLLHWEVADAVEELRRDNDIRVIILTGQEDSFQKPPSELYQSDAGRSNRNDPRRIWKIFNGVLRGHQAMAECEKPIVARVNGDAIGYGMSLVLASDIIVAREDARIIDHHMGMGEIDDLGATYGFVPGDGGSALVPLYMSPPVAKEFLMLAKPYTAEEFAEMNLINYAVPQDELDEKVIEIVNRLLDRSAYALAWTKRSANRLVTDHLNKTLDAAAAYEMVNFLQAEWLDWEDPKQLNWEDGEEFDEAGWSETITNAE